MMVAGGVKEGTVSANRSRVCINTAWGFHHGDPHGASVAGGSCTMRDYGDGNWRQIDLPHDWAAEQPFDIRLPGETGKLPWEGVGWYRKKFRLDAADQGKCIHLEIDGAMSYATVWVNGYRAGGWPYGYTSFEVDLTPHLVFDEDNVLAIRLENPPESSRWYPGGGLYRNVWLRKTHPVAVVYNGVRIVADTIAERLASLSVAIDVGNQSADPVAVRALVHVSAKGPAGRVTGGDIYLGESARPMEVRPGGVVRLVVEGVLEHPRLWDIDTPSLYEAIIRIVREPEVLDIRRERFGLRTIRFNATSGFWLNGRRLRLQGVCMHHDLGPLGAAINRRAMERQLQLLREMGCNAIRCTHNPPAPEWLDLCDEMGFLVIDELVDCWREAKKPNGYQSLFDRWAEKDLRAMVRRDRNHPCVILWSTGNEIPEQIMPTGVELSSCLNAIVREEDLTRGITAGMNHVESAFNGFERTFDVFGWNYKPSHYAEFIAKNPVLPLLGSETASCISSRGEYVFPVSEDQAAGKARFHVSSYDLYAPHWATTPDVEFEHQDRNPSVAGEFVWTGFDYLGEPTPYNDDASTLLNIADPVAREELRHELIALGKLQMPARSSYFGILDLCGFRKDRFYLYQARWRPELPMAHLLPHWNWPERVGQTTPVHLYTSGDEAELFLNGRSLGRKKRGPFDYRLRWDDVVYEPGELRAVAYKAGLGWAAASRQTAGEPAAIRATADRLRIAPDGTDLAFVTVEIVDSHSQLVPTANVRLNFDLQGDGEIAAVDNGDPTRLEPFRATVCATFNGLALAILHFRRGGRGSLTLSVRSGALSPASVTINS